MDVLMECCWGEDIHKDMVKACIIQGWLEDPSIYREQFGPGREQAETQGQGQKGG